MYGCYRHHKKASGDKVDNVDIGDAEQGTYDVHGLSQTSNNVSSHEKTLNPPVEDLVRQPAGIWGYIFQIIFQVLFSYHFFLGVCFSLISLNRILMHIVMIF